jgi:hypothetical protein
MVKTDAKKAATSPHRASAVKIRVIDDTAFALGFNRHFRRAWNVALVEKLRLAALAEGKDAEPDTPWFETACQARRRTLNNSKTGLPKVSEAAAEQFVALDELHERDPRAMPVLGGRVLYAAPPARRRLGAQDDLQRGLVLCIWMPQAGAEQTALAAICPWEDVTLNALVVVDSKTAVWRGSEVLDSALKPLAKLEFLKRAKLANGHVPDYEAKLRWAKMKAATRHPKLDQQYATHLLLMEIIEHTREQGSFPVDRY